ncbi:hypothetical protein HMPREF0971_00293 [Segatella oris F0302]|uniref:Uncharacterized protein n=1 Tax=Segatella oris F0302 TaxID=649760 RepID=D1QMK9_9BACT|nr:hypothetical protein HMPREF0971_00293 [Segatella oris F0302]
MMHDVLRNVSSATANYALFIMHYALTKGGRKQACRRLTKGLLAFRANAKRLQQLERYGENAIADAGGWNFIPYTLFCNT